MKKDWMIKETMLDDDQLKILTATLDKSCIIQGCAGSGKSVLALIKAQRVQKERGNNYKIIVFTKALCHYMNSGRKDLGLTQPFVYHWEWQKRQGCVPADYIIVDEIQDFTEEEISEFINATKKHFFFFGDTAQSIYEGLKETMPVEEIGYLLPRGNKPKDFALYRNYRLPLAMAKYVQHIGIGLPPFDESIYKSPEKTIPRVIGYDNLARQTEAIASIIKRGELTDVGILVPHNEKVIEIGNLLSGFGVSVELRYNDREDWRNSKDTLNFSTTNPKVMTYHSAKGLQFETVFLPAIEQFDETKVSDCKALYVAMTRTYKDLYVMYSRRLPGLLNKIPASLYKTTEVEQVESIW